MANRCKSERFRSKSIRMRMSRAAFASPFAFRSFLHQQPRVSKCSLGSMSIAAGGADTEERFDVLREDGTPAGFSKARSLVHRDGDWHRSTHIWVLATDGRLLVQKRSSLKDTFPGRWDVSAAGHISAGDSSLPSAERELMEELGVSVSDSPQLELVTSEKASATGSTERHGKFLDNEIQDIYVYRPRETLPLESFTLQEEEVDEVQYWDWNEYKTRLLSGDESLVPRSPGYFERFFPWLEREIGGK